jgi:hypothetical protein
LFTEFSSRSIHHSCIHISVNNCLWLVSKQKKLLYNKRSCIAGSLGL